MSASNWLYAIAGLLGLAVILGMLGAFLWMLWQEESKWFAIAFTVLLIALALFITAGVLQQGVTR